MSSDGLDHTALEERGYSLIPGIVAADRLDEFEDQIRRIGEIERRKHHTDAGEVEPLCSALSLGGTYRTMLFDKIKQLAVVHDMTRDVMMRLGDSGALAKLGIQILTFYQTLKGDLPGDELFVLPYHQDYKLTRSHRAFRAWIPLRDANRINGSIELAVGSHRGTFKYEMAADGYRYIPSKQVEGQYETVAIELPRGSCVLFNPLLVHRTVPSSGKRMKFALIIQIEDAAALADPFDANDRITRLVPL
jgi:hypothetical protein